MYGNHYQVVWIKTSKPWDPSTDELPDEFRIVGSLQADVTSEVAEAIATVANLDSDLLHRRGRWAMVLPAQLAQ